MSSHTSSYIQVAEGTISTHNSSRRSSSSSNSSSNKGIEYRYGSLISNTSQLNVKILIITIVVLVRSISNISSSNSGDSRNNNSKNNYLKLENGSNPA